MDSLELNLALVKAIKQYPCLYDSNLPAYTKKDITDVAWNEISNEIGIQAAECKWKWKNLRWGFIRSLRPNNDGSVKKRYYLHEQMEFIIPFIKLHPKRDNYIHPPQNDEEQDEDEDNMPLIGSEFLEFETIEDPHIEKSSGNDESITRQTAEKSGQIRNGQSSVFCEYDAFPEPPRKRPRTHEARHFHLADSRRNFLLGLLPELNVLTEQQMRSFRRKVFQLIDNIVDISQNNSDPIEVEKTSDKPVIIKSEFPE